MVLCPFGCGEMIEVARLQEERLAAWKCLGCGFANVLELGPEEEGDPDD